MQKVLPRIFLLVLSLCGLAPFVRAQPCRTGEPKLFEAIQYGDHTRTALLLEAGANPNARIGLKNAASLDEETACATALMYATWLGDVETTKLLLNAHADIKARDNWGRLVWSYAFGFETIRRIEPESVSEEMNRRLAIANLLLEHGISVDADVRGPWTPAFHSVEAAELTCDLRILKAVIAAGGSLNPPDDSSILAYGVGFSHWSNAEARARAIAKFDTHSQVVETLIAAGANPNAGRGKYTALVAEAKGARVTGAANRIKLLLVAGADVNLPSFQDQTPLIAAITPDAALYDFGPKRTRNEILRDQIDVVKLLLKAGAKASQLDAKKNSLLHMAMSAYRYYQWDEMVSENESVFKLLIDAGADVNAINDSGNSVLTMALSEDYANSKVPADRFPIVKTLVANGANVNFSGPGDQTPLLLALKYADDEFAQLLLNNRAHVNVSDRDGNTPLLAAVTGIRRKLVQELIEKGADVNAQDRDGQTPLIAAINQSIYHDGYYSYTEQINDIIRILIATKPNLDVKDAKGDTALIIAARARWDGGHLAALIAAGADVNAKNWAGDSALIIAARRLGSAGSRNYYEKGNPAPIRALISAGANVNVIGGNGESALTTLAAINPSDSANIVRELLAAAKRAGIKLLRPIDLFTAVRRAAGHSSPEIVKELLGAGADANAIDDDGRTVLTIAVSESGNVEVVRSLLAAGAKVNAIDENGNLPLIAAIREFEAGNDKARDALRRDPEIVRVLLDAGADINLADGSGDRAIEAAARSHNEKIISLISGHRTQR